MVNDLSIATTIISVFILIGVLLPFVQSDFNTSTTSGYNNSVKTGLSKEISNQLDDTPSSVGALSIVGSVAKMFFWTFGALPFWLDAIFLIFRIILVLILIKYIPFIGAGG